MLTKYNRTATALIAATLAISMPAILPTTAYAQAKDIVAQADDAFNAKDYDKSFKLYLKAAESGNEGAYTNLGYSYEFALGTPEDLTAAAFWYKKAAEAGDRVGQNNYGFMLQNGRGVEQNHQEALSWYQKSADKGYPSAMTNVGFMYEMGFGVDASYDEAFKWYKRAAEAGDQYGQNNLGIMYQYGNGTAKDDAEAVKWYLKSANQGHGAAQANLGYMYEFGLGVKEDLKQAARWYKKAAEAGDKIGQSSYGYMLQYGRGVAKDEKEAARWYRASADQNYATAQTNLGFLYETGAGVEKSASEAVYWYSKAAAQGERYGQNNLGVMYERGAGVKQDYEEAIKWYKLAADQGLALAQYNLGLMYENGNGVPVDLNEAFRLYTLAIASPDATDEMRKSHEAVKRRLDSGEGTQVAAVEEKGEEVAQAAVEEGTEQVGFFGLKIGNKAGKKVSESNAGEEAMQEETVVAKQDPPPEDVVVKKDSQDEKVALLAQDAAQAKDAAESKVRIQPTGKRRIALVIGNGAYEHAPPLPNPANDARAMTQVLEKIGFEVFSGFDMTKSDLDRKVRDFAKAARQADLAVYFYAGHGIQVAGENYMVPIDAKVEDETALSFELLNMRNVTAFMGGENKVGIVFLDACRNNPFTRSLKRSLSASRSATVSQGLAAVQADGGGLFVAFATAPDDVAADGTGSNSPFTKALVTHLQTPNLEINTLMTRVKRDVKEETNGDQRPWTNTDLTTEVYLTVAN